MTFPLWSLSAGRHELGLLAGVAIGFGFGFVLERAGFGRAPKLAAQFHGYDMTVLKVMFTAIVTAMLGALLLGALGVLDYRALVAHAVSETFVWPMLAGGLALGAGFVLSGYCPGTSCVAAASGKIDGMATVLGVVAGQLAYAGLEHRAWLARFHASGGQGRLFLHDLLHLPARVGAPLVGVAITAVAIACFVGVERLERVLAPRAPWRVAPGGRSFRAVLAGLSALALAGGAAAALPMSGAAASARPAVTIDPADLARRVVERPWTVRILDLRAREACVAARVPGAECVPERELAALRLGGESGARDLVLVTDDGRSLPSAADAYPGRVLALAGGWSGWQGWALTPPAPPPAGASPAEREAYRTRAGIVAAFTSIASAPPPSAAPGAPAPARRDGGGGGCGG